MGLDLGLVALDLSLGLDLNLSWVENLEYSS